MSLADTTQAHDEPLFPGIEARLVGSRDERRVGEGGSFDRVLVSEVGADEEALFRRKFVGIVDLVCHNIEVGLKCAVEVFVSIVELLVRGCQRRSHLVLGHRQDPLDNELDPRLTIR